MFRKSIVLLASVAILSCGTTHDSPNEELRSSVESGTATTETVDTIIQQSSTITEPTKGSNNSYKEVTACGGLLSLSIPREFTVMTPEMINVKYPRSNSRPKEVFTNEAHNVNIGLTLTTEPITPEKLPSFESTLVSQLRAGKVEGLRSNIEKINGQDFIILEFSNKAIDTKVYNLMFITDVDGRILIGTFNCVSRLLDEWKPKGMEIISSLRKL